jgi:membrane protease YdiL (CAAX protease family)
VSDDRPPDGGAEAPGGGSDPADGGGGDGRRRDPRLAAAWLAVTAGLAVLVTGFVIVALLTGGPGGDLDAEWYIAVGSTTLVVFGPFALLAALGGHGLLQRRQWAPLLLLFGGTMVAGAGLAIVALTASYATTPSDAGGVPLDWVFEQVDDEALWILVAFAALLAVIGTLEAASGVMGRGAAQPPRRDPARARV